MKHNLCIIFLLTISLFQSYGQCLTNVNFNNGWSQAGILANGQWLVTGGGSEVRQLINGNNTFFISPFNLINVKINGTFRTTDSDDDWMGFVWGFNNPIGQVYDYDCWLFDWKQRDQGSAPEGMSVVRVLGTISAAMETTTFGDHVSTPEFNVVWSNWGPGTGWIRNYNHQFQLIYTTSRITIIIDGDTVFTQQGCYSPGRFGFYNRSQRDVYYSGFSYSLAIDFVIKTPQVCANDTARFQFLDTCITGFNFGYYQSLDWDFGDGTTLLITNPNAQNVNPWHIYRNPGNYTVSLTVTDSLGCSDTRSKQITVLPRPVADFTANPVCEGDAVNFIDN